MKKISYFLLRTALWGLLPLAVHAQSSCVTATQLHAEGATQTVTFTLTWSGCTTTNHLTKAWCFIDYRRAYPDGSKDLTWHRATIIGAASVTNGTYEPGHSTGFYVTGTDGQLATVTAKLDHDVSSWYDWCAYATDFPPNVNYSYDFGTITTGTYTFRGTPPFMLTASNGVTQTVTGKVLPYAAMTLTTPATLTDATDCTVPFCPYTGTDLLVEGTHTCKIRTSGTYNWEAWIKDPRDGKKYRIVQMPDGKWWLAQGLNFQGYPGTSATLTYNTSRNCGSHACVGHYFCYNNNLAACDTYGAIYSWEAVIMADGCYWDEPAKTNGVPSSPCTPGNTNWKAPTVHCTAAPSSPNCTISNARGDDHRGICPPGWHLPTDYEVAYLAGSVDPARKNDYINVSGDGWIGSESTHIAGAHLKSTPTVATGGSNSETNPTWHNSSGNEGRDTYGYSWLPSGYRDGTGYFGMGSRGDVWNASAYSSSIANNWQADNSHKRLERWRGEGYTYGHAGTRCVSNL